MKSLVCESILKRSLYQGSAFFTSLFLSLVAISMLSFCMNNQKPYIYISIICSIASFAILGFDLEIRMFDPVLLSEILFGISAAINPIIVMDYLLKYIGIKFTKAISTVQIIESMMALAIPLYAIFTTDKGLTVHMETLCVIGMILGIFSITFSFFILVEFPKNTTEDDFESLRWIGFINGRDLPSDV